MPEGSVSHWIEDLKAGKDQAAQHLWQRYFTRLMAVAKERLQTSPRRAADEEDVAQSAFASLCLGAREGKFDQLRDRENLWALLYAIAANKARRLKEHEGAAKRGGGRVYDQAVLDGKPGSSGEGAVGLEQVATSDPGPEFTAQMAEEYRLLLNRLGDATLQAVAVWKMEGWTNEEIATQLGCVVRTVERKLEQIRETWSSE